MQCWRGEGTYYVLRLDSLDEFRILRVVYMSAERDILDRDFARDIRALERNEIFRFSHDVLSENP